MDNEQIPGENGGNRENPLRTLVLTGQRFDYPAQGEWRWMAGWIKPCPQDLGWLQPSVVITHQGIPPQVFENPGSSFVEKWAVELFLGCIYVFGAVCMLIFATRTDQPYLLHLSGGILFAAGIYFYTTAWKMSLVLFGLAITLAIFGIYILVHRFSNIHRPKA